MQVKQRLNINVLVSVITAVALLLVLSVALYRVSRAMETSNIADQLVESAFERSTFRADYLRSNSERARIQWFAKYEQIGGLLNAASESFSNAEDRKTIDGLINDHLTTGKLFSAIVANRGRGGLNAGPAALAQETEDRLVAQLNMRLYEKLLSIRNLHESARGSLFSAQRLAGLSIFAAFAIIIAVTLINSWTMRRIITDRILRLRNGAAVIGGGNLDHRIDIEGDDEFTELSGAFNAMTAKLCVYRDNIGKEMKERKQAEDMLLHRSEKLEIINRELAKSEARYYSLFENMMHGFAYCRMLYSEGDPVDFIYLDANTAFGKLTGLENVIGRRVTEVIPGIREMHPEIFDIYSRVALTGQPEGFEIEFKPLEIWLSISVYSPAREHFVAIFDNITERKRSEEAMHASEEKYRRIVETANEGIWVVDVDRRTTYVNNNMAEMLGCSVQEMIGKSGLEFLDPEGVSVSHLNFEKRRRGISESYEFKLVRKDKAPLWTIVNATPLVGKDGKFSGTLSMLTDITERKLAEDALQKNAEQLRAQNIKLEDVNKELEAFIYSVAHDLRAPLRHMSGFAGFLKEDYIDLLDEQGRDYLMRINRSSEKMSRLIEDLLDLSRISKQQMRLMEIDLSKLAGDIVAGLCEANPERRVEIFIEEGLKAHVDKPLMDIVLSNLLDNAWKFTSKTENARIEFGRGLSQFTAEAERRRRIGTVPVTTDLYFVRDNGVGFNHEYMEKMFWPFQRLHSEKEFPGTGIGLAIVERIIRRHGGQVWAEGDIGKGAVIYFTVG